jgi:amino acid permease
VLVGKYANLHGFDHFMNVVIIISVLSIGCAGVYGGSRTLTAMGQQGYAPRFFGYIDKSGRPLWSVVFIIVFGVLAYVNLNASGPEVFAWLQALSGLAALLTWGSICLAHIRFRAAWKHHGHTLDEIPFRAVFGVWGSWLGLVLNVLVLIAQVGCSASVTGLVPSPSISSPERPANLTVPPSSTSPSRTRSTRATPATSSRRTSPSPSCSPFGCLAISGSTRAG